MNVEELTIPQKKAEAEFQALKQAFKQNTKLKRDEIRQDLKKAYGFLRHGRKIIDLQESFKKAGLNKDGSPKLAIVRADSRHVILTRSADGSARFWHDRGLKNTTLRSWWRWRGDKDDVTFPAGVFEWHKNENGYGHKTGNLMTVVPIIPAKILVKEVKVLLKNFHILWEVEEWKPIPPKDPILLKRLTPNLYGILATWNLTKLERAIIRGRIQTGAS